MEFVPIFDIHPELSKNFKEYPLTMMKFHCND